MSETKTELGMQLMPMLRKAEEFHGHFGPFLVIGLRAGLIALRELKAERGDPNLSATIWLNYSIPFSCTADGVQVATSCTIGNKRLNLRDSPTIIIRLEKKRDNRYVELAVNDKTYNKMKDQLLAANMDDSKIRELAHIVAVMDEFELFKMKSHNPSD